MFLGHQLQLVVSLGERHGQVTLLVGDELRAFGTALHRLESVAFLLRQLKNDDVLLRKRLTVFEDIQ